MIGVVLAFGSEVIEVRVEGNSVYFRNAAGSGTFATINGLKLDKLGVLREFPELKDNSEWQNIARERFKERIKSYNTEMEKVNYVMEDLKKYGYVPMYIQRQGHRTRKIK